MPKVRHLLRHYYTPGDTAFPGSWVGRITMLWLGVIGILSILQALFVLEWQFLIHFSLSWVEAGLAFLFTLALIWVNIVSARDIEKLTSGDATSFSTHEMECAKRSREDAAADLGIVLVWFVFIILNLILVNCFYFGNPANEKWLNGNGAYVNYPLSYFGTTYDPAIVQRTIMRIAIHLFYSFYAAVIIGMVLRSRPDGQRLYADVERIKHSGAGEGNSADAARLAGNATKQEMRPLNATLISAPTTIVV